MSRSGYIGIDGGGTKTHFVLIDEAGDVLAEHDAGTSYHLQVGVEGVKAVLEQGIAALSTAAIDHIAHVFIGLPAFGEHSVVDPVLEALPAAILGHRRYTCGNDMVCGWAGSLGCEDGINIVAGTGSIGYGERKGATARGGGWGELFSDEGSAYWVAIQGLNAFSRMSDGRLTKSALHGAFRDHLGLARDIDICSQTMGRAAMTRDQIAGLSRVVTACAAAGDLVASAICDKAGGELAAIAEAIRAELDFSPTEVVPLSYSGGLFTAGSALLVPFREHLSKLGSSFDLREPRYSPSYGAAIYAQKRSTQFCDKG